MPRAKDLDKRTASTCAFEKFVDQERRRIFDGASPERQQQMLAAEHRREVFAAWNTVCGKTREGSHVTGLRYLPESNELLVYLDGPAWTQEMTMLREIVRARMERLGVKLDGLIFRTSHTKKDASATASAAIPAKEKSVQVERRELTADERISIEEEVAPIEDARLREALKKAMIASSTCKLAKKG